MVHVKHFFVRIKDIAREWQIFEYGEELFIAEVVESCSDS